VDNLTHSLVGALIGQTGLKRTTGLAMPALIIGANLPDVDAACFAWLEGVEHLALRRGITHGPPALILLPLLLASALWAFDAWQTRRGTRPEGRLPVRFGWLYALSLIGCLTHPALDWMNVYGIRLLEPFSSRWFHADVLFIIDPWLLGIIGSGVWLSLRRERRGKSWRVNARIALALALLYIGVNAWITASTERMLQGAFGRTATVIASPAPGLFWQREGLVSDRPHRWSIAPTDRGPLHLGAEPIASARCQWPDERELATGGSQSRAFLFWAQAPFAEDAGDGSVILRDARFYDPQARDRFSVPLPKLACIAAN
jgi:inner membrane protein